MYWNTLDQLKIYKYIQNTDQKKKSIKTKKDGTVLYTGT